MVVLVVVCADAVELFQAESQRLEPRMANAAVLIRDPAFGNAALPAGLVRCVGWLFSFGIFRFVEADH